MKFTGNWLLMGVVLIVATACKKDSGGTRQVAPTNLVVNTVISTDGSGQVDFTAVADNAVSYDFEFGTGVVKTVANGVTSYTYTVVGTNTFPVIVTARSSSGLTLKKTVSVTVTVKEPFGTLVWSEEFNNDGAPDPVKWGYDIGTGSGGWGNNELEYYTNRQANSWVSGGVLKINALKESFSGSQYTSARLVSKDKFAFTYGKVEIRAKLPAGVGTWPALWMLGSDVNTVGWPACGEIDIMEHLGRDLNKIYGTLHYPGRSGGNADGSTKTIANATTEFHRYGLEWTAESIKISVDDEVFHVTANSGSLPFNHDFFFILNVALGGNFGGPVDPAFTNATMEVDYIRVYK